jgi:AcrR family transcriptional regulator
MRRKNVNNAIIRECITEALLRLMKKKPFTQITVSEITLLAGVARVSFYRNYESKEDILVQKLNEAAVAWFEIISEDANEDIVLGLFRHSLEMKEMAQLVYQHNLSHLLFKNIHDCVGPKSTDTVEEAYQNAYLAGSMFGVLDEWIRRGMNTSPEEMSEIFPHCRYRSFFKTE